MATLLPVHFSFFERNSEYSDTENSLNCHSMRRIERYIKPYEMLNFIIKRLKEKKDN